MFIKPDSDRRLTSRKQTPANVARGINNCFFYLFLLIFIKMREEVIFCFLFGYLSCVMAQKTCGDCTPFGSCAAANALFNNRDQASNKKLQAAFCGFHNNGLPMVCCSELSPPAPTSPPPTPSADSVEGHQNLRLLPEVCGEIEGDKIVGGREAGLYEYPWMVLLSYRTRNGLQFQCGGSLINERYVLTAAHCVAGVVGQKLAGVRVGDHDWETDEDCQHEPPRRICETHLQDIRIQEITPHPGYIGKPRVRNDIALLRLKTLVKLDHNNTRTAVCLPVTTAMQQREVRGQNATVCGWGFTETGFVSSKLLTVQVPIHSQEACSELYNRGSQPGSEDETINKLCAGMENKDSCGGDSGGPLMVKGSYKNSPEDRFIQHGIVSYGPRQCGSEFPGVYTDVSKYMKWILDNIRP